jgi:hypothetical protein
MIVKKNFNDPIGLVHIYGYCPICGSPGHFRENDQNGKDICANKHSYLTKDAVYRYSMIQKIKG